MELSRGPYEVLWASDGRPACVAVVDDWPMALISTASGRPSLVDPLKLLGISSASLMAKVRRPGDLEVIGEATLNRGRLESLEAPVMGWALLDVFDLEPLASRAASLILEVRPRLVYLVRGFTSPADLEVASLTIAAGAPLIVPGFRGANDLTKAWGRASVIVDLRSLGGAAEEVPLEGGLGREEALRLLRGTGAGC
ncbi:MAG: hypothetical protein RXN88_04525 [Acidilobus sp.]